MDKKRLYQFMNTKLHMVLSTVAADGSPESAVVGFGITADFQLIFGTSYTTRKARNIAGNNKVSAVIGWDAEGTVQYQGTARQLQPDEVDKYAEIYFSKNHHARAHKSNPDERYFLIEPEWIRFTDVAQNPWVVTEFAF